jgi:hypothetical protein
MARRERSSAAPAARPHRAPIRSPAGSGRAVARAASAGRDPAPDRAPWRADGGQIVQPAKAVQFGHATHRRHVGGEEIAAQRDAAQMQLAVDDLFAPSGMADGFGFGAAQKPLGRRCYRSWAGHCWNGATLGPFGRFPQAQDEKPVHAAAFGPHVGAQPQPALRVIQSGSMPGACGGIDGQAGMAGKGGGHLILALGRQKRAGGIDQPPAGFQDA